MPKAISIVLANGLFQDVAGKTAHGLVRYSSRFCVAAVVDPLCAGKDAGMVLDGRHRGIPIFDSVKNAAQALHSQGLSPQYCIIGVATRGGKIPPHLEKEILNAIDHRMSVINGLHQFLANNQKVSRQARKKKVDLVDIRKPPQNPYFWTGQIFSVKAPRIAVLGTDCAIGKRTTTILLLEALRKGGIKAEMIYTGQTGWMQGIKHGLIFDATPNDFISGEVERAICRCDRELKPDVILIEGQSALQNPSGPCGSEFLKSADAKGVILHHQPGRKYFHGIEKYRCRTPKVEDEIKLIEMYGSKVLAVTLNEADISGRKLEKYRRNLRGKIGIPVLLPLRGELNELIPRIRQFIGKNKKR